MALSQVLWSLGQNKPLDTASLLSERELEDVLQDNISLLNPDWLVIGRQVATPNGKYLDLLCIDRDADLVVVELKRDLTPREVTAQVIEYASYMAEKQPEEIAQIYLSYTQHYLSSSTTLDTAYQNKFGVPLDEESVNQKVKMVIVAAKMDDGTEHIIQYLRQTYTTFSFSKSSATERTGSSAGSGWRRTWRPKSPFARRASGTRSIISPSAPVNAPGKTQ